MAGKDKEDSPFSFRDKIVLGRALREEQLEPEDRDVSSDLTLGVESASDLTLDPDPDMFSIPVPTSDSKRLRLGTESSSVKGQTGLPDYRVLMDTSAAKLLSTELAKLPSPYINHLPPPTSTLHSFTSREVSKETGHTTAGTSVMPPPRNLETMDDDICSLAPSPPLTVPSPLGESQSYADSQTTRLSAALYDAETHFGPDYFWNYCDEDFPISAPTFNDSFESFELSEGESSDGEEQTTEKVVVNIPLYKGSPISQAESLASVLSFVQSEHISGAGLSRLLSLINLHLPKPNNFLKTNNSLLHVLEELDEPVHNHYFCSICYKIRNDSSDICDTCTDPIKSVLFFITFPLVAQLQKMLKRPNFREDLKYKEMRIKRNVNNIEDIYDGEIYKEAERKFVEHCINITLMWNTDGMQIFNSNSYSLWPFYLVINELAPNKRFLSENLLIAGVWGSTVKPHPNVYLLPIYKDLITMKEGIEVMCHGEKELQKLVVYVICGTCDAPARASFKNMKQHSGFYSCPVCLVKGEKPGRCHCISLQ